MSTNTPALTLPDTAVADLKVSQSRVLLSEWTKLRSLRSTYLTLLAAIVLTIALGTLFSFGAASRWEKMSAPQKALFDPTTTSLNGFFLTQLLIGVLGVLVVTGEYPTGMIRATFAAVPHRLPVLWAKVIVFSVTTFVLMAATGLVAFLVGQAVLNTKQIGTTLGAPGVPQAILGFALYLTIVAILGVALGAIVRKTAGGIGIIVAVLLIVPILARLLPGDWADAIDKYLPSNAGQVILHVMPQPSSLTPWGGLALFLAYAIAALVAGAILIVKRDA